MKTRKAVRHSPKTVTGRPRKIGVEKGFGPRHGANAKEGEEIGGQKSEVRDLTKVNSDVVPAMLTPREAVLNRNAAELAGRDKIEALNEEGNALAKKGVDLAGGEKPLRAAEGVRDIQENPYAAQQAQQQYPDFWHYMNPWGGTTKGGSNTGIPTQKGIGTAVGTLTNFFIPGLGYVTGPIARWITSKIQGGLTHDQAVQAAQDAGVTGSSEPPPMPSGSVDLPQYNTSGGGAGRGDKWHDLFGPRWSASGVPGQGVGIGPTGQAAVGREWWSPDFGRWNLGEQGTGAGNTNLSGPGGWAIGSRGLGFGNNTVGNWATAIGFDQLGAGSGPSNLNWTAGAWGDSGDRPHMNPYFGGFSADKQAGGPGVKLRAKGDSDVEGKSMKSKPKQSKSEKSGSPYVAGFERLMPKGYASGGYVPAGSTTSTDPAGGPPRFGEGQLNYMRRYGQLPPEMGGGALGQGQENLLNMVRGGGQIKPGELPAAGGDPVPAGHSWNPTQYDPGMHTVGYGGGNTGSGIMGSGPNPNLGGRYGEPPGSYGVGGSGGGLGQPFNLPPGQKTNQMSNSFYPDNQWFGGGARKTPGYAEGTGEVRGSSINDNFGPPPQLSAPDISALLKVLKEQGGKNGLNAAQIQGLMSAFQGMGGGGVGTAGAGSYFGSNDAAMGAAMGQLGGYQGGISEVGYPPGIAPRADFSYEEGGWTGPLDPRWSSPGYARGNPDVPGWDEPDELNQDTGPRGLRFSTMAGGGDAYNPRDFGGWNNYSNVFNSLQSPGWSVGGGTTRIPTNWSWQGPAFGWTPQAVPVVTSDVNLQGNRGHLPKMNPK